MGVRRGAMKYFEGARAELYDIDHDPAEADNLAQRDAAARGRSARGARAVPARRRRSRRRRRRDSRSSTTRPSKQLASLGYVGGTAATPARSGQGLHPPDLVDLEQELLRAQTAVTENRWGEAADALDFILKRDPTNRFALHFRSVAFSRRGDFAKAIELARAMLAIYPDSPESSDLLGETLSQAGRPGEAAQVYADALVKHPDNALLRYHRTLALVEAKRIDEAESEVAQLAKLATERGDDCGGPVHPRRDSRTRGRIPSMPSIAPFARVFGISPWSMRPPGSSRSARTLDTAPWSKRPQRRIGPKSQENLSKQIACWAVGVRRILPPRLGPGRGGF